MRSAAGIPRSTLVRERQKKQSEEKMTQTSRVVQPPVIKNTMPITARRSVYATTYPNYPKQSTRRQFNYAIGATGAEIRLPAISSIHIGWRLLSFFMGLFCLVGIFLIFNSPQFQINQIQTSGLSRLTINDVDAVLKIQGESVIWLDTAQAKKDLEIAFPELKDIQITIDLPNQINLSATERQPVLLWQTDKQAYWLDQEGVLIPPRGEVGELITIHASAPPPLVISNTEQITTGTNFKQNQNELARLAVSELQGWGETVDPNLIDAAYQLMAFLPADANILYNKTHGLGWKAEQGWDVFVGLTLNDINYKLNAYQVLVEKFTKEGLQPSMVSVEFTDRPYYRE